VATRKAHTTDLGTEVVSRGLRCVCTCMNVLVCMLCCVCCAVCVLCCALLCVYVRGEGAPLTCSLAQQRRRPGVRMQAQGCACKPRGVHASPGVCMQSQGCACKPRGVHASPGVCMQAQGVHARPGVRMQAQPGVCICASWPGGAMCALERGVAAYPGHAAAGQGHALWRPITRVRALLGTLHCAVRRKVAS